MRIDHVSYAASPEGLQATAEHLSSRLGITPRDGGVHPRFGTRNVILPLAGDRYVEVVEVLDHPASDKAPFGQAVRARSATGGGWMAWVVAVDDLSDVEARLGRRSVEGQRHTPEGVELQWRQIGIRGLIADPQLPFFIQWSTMDHHPSRLEESAVRLTGLHISGEAARVREWLGLTEPGSWGDGVDFDFQSAGGPAALASVTFEGPDGPVTI
ncbi:VOC family protein [Ornithinimicrobium sp. F0845]|uniref:VOC family protein n=1 Tax=Ornithinimicrobium sp. F0845 TaxID=2926412 RepID=UPI001FF45DC0|nr:VOC family protein [Ornithinimicrobium sp. F0845]MCK0112161.1 VOC family protein [Ornithinimicrobium sp. F0845]